ncbi:DUF4249 domain-containing protein [Larkinella soli]|uniref:DUF4249 domain-containing protein n=1 Tax=Larkinella soli TaxID=1770527 RepID=UPI000FFBCAD6|nr:DUF4249 domain-containing protein [Larkinella soli]
MKSTHRFLKLLLSAVAVLPLGGCEDTISVNLKEGERLVVVEGSITDRPGPYTVRLSTTAPYFSNQPTPRLSGAEVVLSDDRGDREVLTETGPGLYQTHRLQGRVGGKYALTVRVNGEEYEAQTEIRRVPVIDSLRSGFRKATEARDAGYFLTYFGPEPAGGPDFYRVKIFRNDTLLNDPQLDLFFFSDDHIDGNYLNGLELGAGPFRPGDNARVELHGITEETFRYLRELQKQMRNDGLFSSPTANVRTNIRNTRPGGKPATGWFGGSAVRTGTLVIRK